MPRKIAVVTTSRADYGIFRPVIKEMLRRRNLDVQILVTGSHLSPTHGMTIREIEADGFPIATRIPALRSGDTPQDIAANMGNTVKGFGVAYGRVRPDMILVLGDRYEMFAAALAAVPFAIPLAHIHGGEITLGAFDDALRHALTKLSHIHFVSTVQYRRRIIQMGEQPSRVIVSGAPGLDAIRTLIPLTRRQLAQKLGFAMASDPLLVTYHPETLSRRSPADDTRRLLRAINSFRGPIIVTGANADVGASEIRHAMRQFAADAADRLYVANLGNQIYLSLMKIAAALVGNSSSGIIEAASFATPVVNIGERQAGRMRPRNVIDCACQTGSIAAALRTALSTAFRRRLKGMKNPYGDGRSARLIANTLADPWMTAPNLLKKRFQDLRYMLPKA